MPIYDFQCRACDHRYEDLVSYAEVDSQTCPVCASSEVGRLASTFLVGAGVGASSESSMYAGGACAPGPAGGGGGGGCCGGGCGGCG